MVDGSKLPLHRVRAPLPELGWRKLETPPETRRQRVRRIVADWLERLADRVRWG